MGNEALWEAIRRSVEKRNRDPELMRRWLDDWDDRYVDDYCGDAATTETEEDYYV